MTLISSTNNNENELINTMSSDSTSTTNQQLDELLSELSREAGFRNYRAHSETIKNNNSNNKNSQTTINIPSINRNGYYSDFESSHKKSNNFDFHFRPSSSSGKMNEKTHTREEYIREEFLGHLENQSKTSNLSNINFSTSNNINNDSSFKPGSSKQHVNHKYFNTQGFGEVTILPVPPPRKQSKSPFHNKMNQQKEQLTNNQTRKSRFDTTNTKNETRPLEVKGLLTSGSEEEGVDWAEERRRLVRDNRSVDRLATDYQQDFTFNKKLQNNVRSGSLDVDLDDMVQRNLTGKNEEGSYYISGLERPAIRTRLPHTKYIFKISSPFSGQSIKTEEKETFSSHISLPPPPPPPPEIKKSQEKALDEIQANMRTFLQENIRKKQVPSKKNKEIIPQKLNYKKDDVEVVSLEPIGPGVQLLETITNNHFSRGQAFNYQESKNTTLRTRTMSPIDKKNNSKLVAYNNQIINNINNSIVPSNGTTSNYTAYDSFYHEQRLQQPIVTQFPVFNNFDSFSNFVNNNNFKQQNQQFQQQQQYSIPVQVQQSFVPFSFNNNLKTEVTNTFKYSETKNVPFQQQSVQQIHSLSCSPNINSRNGVVCSTNNDDNSNTKMEHIMQQQHDPASQQREMSIPVPVEEIFSSTNNKNTMTTNKSNSLSNNQIQSKNITGYKYLENQTQSMKMETPSPIPTNTGSPETIRSWTVSPGSSLKAANNKTNNIITKTKNNNLLSSKIYSDKNNVSQILTTEVRTEVANSCSDLNNESEANEYFIGEIETEDLDFQKVKDMAHIWHRPHITRQEAIQMLKHKPAGSFIVRNSHTFAGGFGLAIKVNQLPPSIQAKGDDYEANLVRHFLIESTPKGVRLKGCSNEPVFGSLSALIHQHTITPLSLPCKLLLPRVSAPESETYSNNSANISSFPHINSKLNSNNPSEKDFQNGQVFYITSVTVKSPHLQSLKDSIEKLFEKPYNVTPVEMKISGKEVILNDEKNRIFSRRHFPVQSITCCAQDQNNKMFSFRDEKDKLFNGRVFGFIAKQPENNNQNNFLCHLFTELDGDFSALIIVDLINQAIEAC